METITSRSQKDHDAMIFAMRLSLVAGAVLLVVKMAAAWWSQSVAILSDAAESVAHLLAVGFSYFSLRLSLKPADANHPYGHAKIAFFSSGFEGAMILAAAVLVAYQSVQDLVTHPGLEHAVVGIWFTIGVVIVNGSLGWYLLREGRKRNSIVLEANGQHVLTDCYTSLGVIAGLVLAYATGWKQWDPICALVVSTNMAWTAIRLMRRSFHGLMDQADPQFTEHLEAILTAETKRRGLTYHALRHRNLGDSIWVDVHLVFPPGALLRPSHESATEIEKAVNDAFGPAVYVTTHLESAEDHDRIHPMREREEDSSGE